ncbi:MAG: hypothetical protein ACM3ZE_14475 [Myxococcales bacterium]
MIAARRARWVFTVPEQGGTKNTAAKLRAMATRDIELVLLEALHRVPSEAMSLTGV